MTLDPAEEAALVAGVDREADRLHVVADSPPPGARPRFPGATGSLSRHWVLDGDGELGRRLLAGGQVESAALALRPAPPPGDIAPETPLFEQLWWWNFPDGLGFDEALDYPGADGANVTLVDIEYDWLETHEDLAVGEALAGEPEAVYAFHGSGVLGITSGLANDYGVTGGAAGATALVVHPDFEVDGVLEYDLARAIYEASSVLSAGDVILVEQQVYGPGEEFLPVTWDEGARAAISEATLAGIVVVVPAANGGVDLDDPTYAGVFAIDIGAILVGGGFPPTYGEPRAWAGSDYGEGVHVQAWNTDIVSAGGSPYTDLYFPGGDERQAYTAVFGGTSGASAQVAAACAVVQSVAIATRGTPLSPVELRAAIMASGAPQSGVNHVGPQPDLRRLLRSFVVP